MPRRDRDYDDEPPPAKGGIPVWLILVLGGFGVCVLLCGGVGTLMYMFYKRDVAQREMLVEQEMMMADREEAEMSPEWQGTLHQLERAHKLESNRLSRDEFRTKVAGKTEDEVTANVGKPDSTEEANGEVRWVYERRTRRPDNADTDRRVVLVFRNGRVAEVAFE